jgi:hypothetical protein
MKWTLCGTLFGRQSIKQVTAKGDNVYGFKEGKEPEERDQGTQEQGCQTEKETQ